MMLALMLAQLVLPWPGLDSPLVQPPGMICASGGCEGGPVIYGPAERGRLVVACDMRSDTCSDGRKITTTRSTPVPCEVAPGQWEMVGVDEGCYGVRGLEAWAANTSYLSWGAELDRSPWGPSSRGGTLEALADGWRVHKNLDQPNSGWTQRLTGMGDGAMWTTSYILRTMTPIPMALYAGSSQSCGQETLDTGGQWQTLSCSREVPAPADPVASIYPGANTTGTPYSVDAKAAWTVKGDTPGRACWGGEAPVTCAADRHTISTEGWPTTEGEISWTIRIERLPRSGDPVRGIFGVDEPHSHRLGLTGAGSIFLRTVDGPDAFSPNLEWEVGRPYSMRLVFTPAGWKLYRDGSVVWSVTRTTAFDWGAVARVGSNLDGSISNLRIRGVR